MGRGISPDIAEGQALVRTLYLSLDPTEPFWMRPIASYIPPGRVGRGDAWPRRRTGDQKPARRSAGRAFVLASPAGKNTASQTIPFWNFRSPCFPTLCRRPFRPFWEYLATPVFQRLFGIESGRPQPGGRSSFSPQGVPWVRSLDSLRSTWCPRGGHRRRRRKVPTPGGGTGL